MIGVRLYLLQRITALIMAPLVIGHLAVMIYAVQGGLSASEILGRTQGSLLWALFYGTFAVAVAHPPALGLRAQANATIGGTRTTLAALTGGIFAILAAMGLYAVYAVTA